MPSFRSPATGSTSPVSTAGRLSSSTSRAFAALDTGMGGGVYDQQMGNSGWWLLWNMQRPDDEPGIAPSAAPTPLQQALPASKYGSTIPVVFGRARLAGTYIWSPGFETGTAEGELQSTLTARLRFGASLVADAVWGVRRLWADGTLIYDAGTSYRMSGLSFVSYYGHSAQARDPTMVGIEGEEEVSAHRGYLDIVVADYPISAKNPPVFEAEWVQSDVTDLESDQLTEFNAANAITYPMLIGAGDTFYSISGGSTPQYVKKYSISGLQEISAVPVSGDLGTVMSEARYIRAMNRIVTVDGVPGSFYPVLINPTTGAIAATAAEQGGNGYMQSALAVMFSATAGVYITSSWSGGVLSSFRFTANSILRASSSGAAWDGRGAVHTMAIGSVGASSAVVYFGCEDPVIYRATVSSTGVISSIVAFATLADDCQYLIYREGYLYAWDDSQQLLKISPAGATVATYGLPYQIQSEYNNKRNPPGDMQVITDTVFVSIYNTANDYLTNLETGETTHYTTLPGGANNPLHTWDGSRKLLLSTNVTGGTVWRTYFDIPGDGTLHDLEDLLEALFTARGNFHDSEIEVIGVADQIAGAILNVTRGRRDTARAINDPYRIAMFERAGNIICKRAATDGSFAVDATIAAIDMADRNGKAIAARRSNPEESLARYGISYRDPDEVYQTKTQYGEIPATPLPVAPVDNALSADIPIIHDATTMKTLATKYVNKRAEQRHDFSFVLRAKYLDLEPEDVIRFPFAGRTITARILETVMNPDFTMNVRATEFLSKVDVSIAGAAGRPIVPQPAGNPESVYIHLDIPLIADGHDLEGAGLVQYHVLASAGQPDWDGATLYRASGTTYTPVSSQVIDGLVGVALEVLPDWETPYCTELARTLTVAFTSGDTGDLASVTYQEACEGANMFAIGAPGRWEVCHVIGITDNLDGTFTFEGLRRGRGVSEEHTGDHEDGDLVVWLSGVNVDRLEYAVADLDEAYQFKPVGFGGLLSTTPATAETVTGEAEKIPKPAHLDAVVDGSDIELDWVRRSRIGALWPDDGDDTYETPLGETLEQYVVRIKDGPAGTVLRSYTVDDATTKTYPAADIATDFGSMPAELTFDIRQVSGTGVICPTREATITL